MKPLLTVWAAAALCVLLAACAAGGPFTKETVVVLYPSEPQSVEPVRSGGEPPPPPEAATPSKAAPAAAEPFEAAPGDGEIRDYVLNTRSRKFHLPDCSGLSGMNPANREEFHGTRDEVLEQGYTPCGICKP